MTIGGYIFYPICVFVPSWQRAKKLRRSQRDVLGKKNTKAQNPTKED